MKKIISASLFAISFAFSIVSCGDDAKQQQAPVEEYKKTEEVALQFVKSIESGDVEGLEKSMCFPSDVEKERYKAYFKRVDSMKVMGYHTLSSAAAFEVVSASVSGDTACVKLKGKDAFDKNTEVDVRLFKVKGYWRVDGKFPLTHLKKK